jgi:hypothetical protein
MTERAEACPVLGLKLSPSQVLRVQAKVMGKIADSLGTVEVDQGEEVTKSQLISPTISRQTQMSCRKIKRYITQQTQSHFYKSKTTSNKIILYISKKTHLAAKPMELARTIIAAWGDCRVSVGIVLNDIYASLKLTFSY